MKKHSLSPVSVNRRELFKQVGAAALVSAIGAARSSFSLPASDDPGPRIRATFDFGWKFRSGDFPDAQKPEFSDSGWQSVDLPHDWSIEGPFNESEPAGSPGGYLPTGICWYRKHLHFPAAYKDKTNTIELDGACQNKEEWINRRYLGQRPYR